MPILVPFEHFSVPQDFVSRIIAGKFHHNSSGFTIRGVSGSMRFVYVSFCKLYFQFTFDKFFNQLVSVTVFFL